MLDFPRSRQISATSQCVEISSSLRRRSTAQAPSQDKHERYHDTSKPAIPRLQPEPMDPNAAPRSETVDVWMHDACQARFRNAKPQSGHSTGLFQIRFRHVKPLWMFSPSMIECMPSLNPSVDADKYVYSLSDTTVDTPTRCEPRSLCQLLLRRHFISGRWNRSTDIDCWSPCIARSRTGRENPSKTTTTQKLHGYL